MNTEHRNGNGTANEAHTDEAFSSSKLRYRRLFEAAKDSRRKRCGHVFFLLIITLLHHKSFDLCKPVFLKEVKWLG